MFLPIILASQTFYPTWPIFLHGYIRHIRDISQLCVFVYFCNRVFYIWHMGISYLISLNPISMLIFVQLGVPEYLAAGLERSGNFGLSQGSWKTYGTVWNHLRSCGRDVGRRLEFPLSPRDVLTFLAWLINRGLRAILFKFTSAVSG